MCIFFLVLDFVIAVKPSVASILHVFGEVKVSKNAHEFDTLTNPGKLAHLQLKMEKFASSLGDAFSGSSEIHQLLSSSQFMHLGPDEFHIPRSKGSYVNQASCDYENIALQLSSQQVGW